VTLPRRQSGRRFPSAAVAGVWLYHGLAASCSAAVPSRRGSWQTCRECGPTAKALLVGLGVAETALAGWVISGVRPRPAAASGTALVLAMNGGGLAFGRRHIPAPRALLAENAGFLALAWWAAETDRAAEM
jgi:DoxX-like family